MTTVAAAPPCLHRIASAALFFSLLLLLSFAPALEACSSRPGTSGSSCPPFTSTPSFPFSSTPGCGHPSFQIRCSFPHSIISINNLSFALVQYQPNSSSLNLAPQPLIPATAHRNCPLPQLLSIPNRSINLSGSPFESPTPPVLASPFSVLAPLQICPTAAVVLGNVGSSRTHFNCYMTVDLPMLRFQNRVANQTFWGFLTGS